MRSEVYNIEPNNIYLGDCLDLMPQIQDKSIDMVLCDLPYQVLHKNNPNAQWDRLIPFEPLWEQYKRIIKDNGVIILFAQGMFTAQLMMSQPKLWRYNLVWDKMRVTGFLNANRMPLRCHEDIAVFYKQLPTYNPQMELGQPNHSRGNGKHKETNNKTMIKELSSFRYKRRVEKWFDKLYNGKFGIRHFVFSNDEHGVLYIYDSETKEHIASFVRNVLHTNDLSIV